jgi:hypothetical protein
MTEGGFWIPPEDQKECKPWPYNHLDSTLFLHQHFSLHVILSFAQWVGACLATYYTLLDLLIITVYAVGYYVFVSVEVCHPHSAVILWYKLHWLVNLACLSLCNRTISSSLRDELLSDAILCQSRRAELC